MSDVSQYLISISFASVLLLIFFKFLNRKKYNLPPGPPGKFFFGNLQDFVAPLSYKKWANEFREKYGDVFLLNVVGTKTIIVNDYNLALESFVSKSRNDLAGRPYFFLFRKVTGGNNGSIVMGDFGPRLKLQRKLVHSALRNFMKGPTVEKLVEKSFDKFQEERRGFGGNFIDPRMYLQQLFFNVICSALFGDFYDLNDPKNYEVLDGIQQSTSTFEKLSYLEGAPFLWHFPFKNIRIIKQFLELFQNFALEKIQVHMENLASEPRDITDCFLKELEESDSRQSSLINENVILYSMTDLIFAGTDTSAILLYWLVGFLACNPSIQERIHEEITQYKKTLPPGENSVSISWREHLPYTQATILEGIRCASSLPQGIPHMALNDVKIGEYDVPKGTTVILNQYAFHNDPKFWKQPELFQPERFLDSDGKLLPKQPGLTGFGLGVRSCVGETVAKAGLHMLLVLLCSNYKFEWDPQNEDSYIRESELSNFTRIPASYKIAFKQREA